MGWTRFFSVAGASFIVTGLRADVSTIKHGREVMLTVGGILLVLAVLSYGNSETPAKRRAADGGVKQQ
ncbi:hypothetical protein PLESTF_000689000 [Pleodorina starrii]|nr:hypothetical protein PLESTF_000689000 [Pleodorina starrii]